MPSPPERQTMTSIGAYLCARREAAGLSLDDLSLRLETTPALCARERAELLGEIEAGTAEVPLFDAAVIDAAISFVPSTPAWWLAPSPRLSENDQ